MTVIVVISSTKLSTGPSDNIFLNMPGVQVYVTNRQALHSKVYINNLECKILIVVINIFTWFSFNSSNIIVR